MDPIKRNDHNFLYKGEQKEGERVFNEGVGDLSCRVEEGGYIFSHWRPSAEEVAMLNKGGVIELHIIGHPIPPVGMTVVPMDAPQAKQNGDLHG